MRWIATITACSGSGVRRGIAYTERAFRDSAEAGNLAVVKLFVLAGMSVNTADDGRTILHYAASGGSVSVVEYLVGQGLDVNAQRRSENSLFYLILLSNRWIIAI